MKCGKQHLSSGSPHNRSLWLSILSRCPARAIKARKINQIFWLNLLPKYLDDTGGWNTFQKQQWWGLSSETNTLHGQALAKVAPPTAPRPQAEGAAWQLPLGKWVHVHVWPFLETLSLDPRVSELPSSSCPLPDHRTGLQYPRTSISLRTPRKAEA